MIKLHQYKIIISKFLFALAFSVGLLGVSIRAEEGGSGHYLPGATSSFIDALPGKESFVYVNTFAFYNGSAIGGRQLNLAGNVVANIDANIYANTSIFLYQTPWKIAGGQYAAAIAVPFVWMEVEGNVQIGRRLGNRRDTASGFGDILILPFMLGWKQGDLSYGVSLGIYAPTGEFRAGELANVGKNFWTFEPGAYVSWLSSKTGLELSAFAGLDINTKNHATDYRSGSVFHIDATVAEHLPLGKGFIGIGANAFLYQQISGDSGSGTKLGRFEGRTAGIGPVISYATKIGKTDAVAELKWLPELDTKNRLNGDIIWFKMAFLF